MELLRGDLSRGARHFFLLLLLRKLSERKRWRGEKNNWICRSFVSP